MARRSKRPSFGELNAWPGYVDALSTLLMVVTFVLLIFVLGQQFLSIALSRRSDTLNTAQHQLEDVLKNFQISEAERQALEQRVEKLNEDVDATNSRVVHLQTQLAAAQDTTYAYEAMRAQLQAHEDQTTHHMQLLQAAYDQSQQKIDALTKELAQSKELNGGALDPYRATFFKHLKAVLKSERGVAVVGDRFVFQSAILFPQGSAELTDKGKQQLTMLAHSFLEVSRKIPSNVDWLLRVDGHADRQPIHTVYPSNWELSSARAITVVKMLIQKGVDPRHVAATGFSDYQPLDPAHSPEAYARNRRIEFRLTGR